MPPTAAASMALVVKATLTAALPSASRPAGRVTAAIVDRTSARLTGAISPSAATSTRMPASPARPALSARAAKMVAWLEREGGQQALRAVALEAGDEQRGGEAEQAAVHEPGDRDRHRALGEGVDEDGERDLRGPVAELADGVGAEQAREGGQAKRGAHGGSWRGAGGAGQGWVRRPDARAGGASGRIRRSARGTCRPRPERGASRRPATA